mmetsp:Transcript_14910/g.30012  ORF Transcript_14910/g.30012 Transcript_14910/m.30012 type:complete len:96 (-) Transcript_14910:90-377(-)
MCAEEESGAQRRVEVTRRVEPCGRAARQAKWRRRTRPSAGGGSPEESAAVVMMSAIVLSSRPDVEMWQEQLLWTLNTNETLADICQQKQEAEDIQ